MRNARCIELNAQLAHPILMAHTFELTDLQVLDRGDSARSQRRRQRRREDEARRKRADEITERGRSGDVAAHDAESLAERAFDDSKTIHQALALGNAAAAWAVHADGMHFVEIGHRAIFVGEIADFLDGGDIAIHRINGFKRDQLRRLGIGSLQLGFEIVQVVMLPDDLVALRVPNAFDHRRMVERIREDDEARDACAERAERRPVRNITRGEDQRGFLAMEIGEFLLKQNMVVVGARNIPGASRTRATVINGLLHRLNHFWMLAHAEIIVGAPDSHFLRTIGCIAGSAGEITTAAFEICENPITAFVVKTFQLALKKCFEIHHLLQYRATVFENAGSHVNPSALLSRHAAANGP